MSGKPLQKVLCRELEKMASKGGIRNTVRFRWIVKNAPVMQRELFGRTFLQGLLKLKVDQVYCLQSNAQEKSYDVTFITVGVMEDVLVTCRERAGERHFSSFEIVSLDRPNFRLITLHMYNPHVTKEEMVRFLSSYGEVFTGSRRLMDSCGYWTGRTQFQVLLKEDPGGFDGLAHPPAFFSIAADRGFLFYSRQPPFCKKCRKQGHTEGACGFIRCRICTAYGHEARDCPHKGTCNTCGKAGHFHRDCPERKRTYAEAAGRGPGEAASSSDGDGQRPIAEVEEEDQREIEEVFALTEHDTFYDCPQEEGAKSPSKPNENKAGTAKKSAAKIRKKSPGSGGNGKAGGKDRGSKRGWDEEGGGNVQKGRREERAGEGGGEDQGSSKPMEASEGDTQVQILEGCDLGLGDVLQLPEPVSPLQASEGEEEGGLGTNLGGGIGNWADHVDGVTGEGEVAEALPEVTPVVLPPEQAKNFFGTLESSPGLPKQGVGEDSEGV